MSTITRVRWTNTDIHKMLSLFATGMPYEAIGEQLVRTRSSIEGLVRDLRAGRTHADFWDAFNLASAQRDLSIRLNGRFRWSPGQDALLLRLTRTGMSDAEIAKQIGVSRSSVPSRRFKLRERGAPAEPDAFEDPVLALAISGSWRRAA